MIIAEIGQAHDGSLGNAHAFIEALSGTGVDAIKFQMHIADAESSIHEPFRVKFSRQDITRFDYWKRMEFSKEQWRGLKEHCERYGIEFLASPFSNAAVDILEEIGVTRYKIGSGEITNLLMLEKIAKTGKPLILSSGMSSFEELDNSIDFLKTYGNKVAILQCTTSYPTAPEQWGLNVLSELKIKYGIPVGFSDHSGDIYASLAAAALGAEIFEFHVVFDKRQFGPDSSSSITIDQAFVLVKGIRQIQKALSIQIDKNNNDSFRPLKKIFEKSLSINRDIPKGTTILQEYLEAKKPNGLGIPAYQFRDLIGRTVRRDLVQWDFLLWEDLE